MLVPRLGRSPPELDRVRKYRDVFEPRNVRQAGARFETVASKEPQLREIHGQAPTMATSGARIVLQRAEDPRVLPPVQRHPNLACPTAHFVIVIGNQFPGKEIRASRVQPCIHVAAQTLATHERRRGGGPGSKSQCICVFCPVAFDLDDRRFDAHLLSAQGLSAPIVFQPLSVIVALARESTGG